MANASVACLFPTKVGLVLDPASFRLDTTNFFAAVTPPADDETYTYTPRLALADFAAIRLYSVETAELNLIHTFKIGVDFNVGDIIDFTTFVSGLDDNSSFAFSAVTHATLLPNPWEVLLGFSFVLNTGLSVADYGVVYNATGNIYDYPRYSDGIYETVLADSVKTLVCYDISEVHVLLALENNYPALPIIS